MGVWKMREPGGQSPPYRILVLVLVVTVLVAACRDSDGAFGVVMQDSSMEPTFAARTTVRFQTATVVQRGEVIAFEYPFPYPGKPRRELIARVIGVAGDRLSLSPDGVVINGERLAEPYVKNREQVTPAELIVPPGSFFVLGDDRANQRDSRWWGPLPATKLLGVAEPVS